jgi:hypothetical protein
VKKEEKIFRFQMRIDEETMAMIEELAKEKYRGVDKSRAIKWAIHDTFNRFKNSSEVTERG